LDLPKRSGSDERRLLRLRRLRGQTAIKKNSNNNQGLQRSIHAPTRGQRAYHLNIACDSFGPTLTSSKAKEAEEEDIRYTEGKAAISKPNLTKEITPEANQGQFELEPEREESPSTYHAT
jgi:hypothetical protein